MLAIGSIVYLKDGSKKLMILNRGSMFEVDGEVKIFDYSACIYPIGLIPNKVFYFNQENIDKIVFEGYSDEEEVRFQELYQEWKNENHTIKKGEIIEPLKEDLTPKESETSPKEMKDGRVFGF
jgi:hypothetical protein